MSKPSIFDDRAAATEKAIKNLHGTTLDDKPKPTAVASSEFSHPAPEKKTYSIRIYDDIAEQADEIREQLFTKTKNKALKNRSELVEYLLKKFLQENS